MARTAAWFPAGMALDDEPLVLHDATRVPFKVLRAIQGIEAPVVTVRMLQSPGVHGSRFDSATASRPEVLVPVFLQAESRAQMLALKRDLVAAMMPFSGSGKMLLSDELGTDAGEMRWCEAIYKGGLEGDGSQAGVDWYRFVIRFECPDPFWYSMEPTVASWQGAAFQSFFGSPFFPFSLAPYGLTETVPLDVTGDAESWGVFSLAGPFLRARFTNDRSGLWWEVARGVEDQSAALTVTTKPGAADVATADGATALWQRTAGSRFFPLAAGDTISVEAEGTSQATTFDLTVWPAWLTAP